MGGLFNLFYFNRSTMAKKTLARKRNVDDWSEKTCYPIEASMKRLINEEIFEQSNTRKNAPSIVARLMGVDMLPIDTKYGVQPVDKRNRSVVTKHPKRDKNERSSVKHLSSNSDSSRQMELDSVYNKKERDVNGWSNGWKLGKPRPREHPQEEELQKFKKEFEAWQAARFKECSKIVELGSNPDQLLSQEKINKQKMVLNDEKPTEHKGHALKARSPERASLHHNRHKLELFPAEQMDSYSSRYGGINKNYEHASLDYHQKLDKYTASTKIMILKPGPDRFIDPEESQMSSSCTFVGRGSLENFIEEVKECELHGKTPKRGFVVRGSGTETRFCEKPSDPKQIAKHIAKHVRESVTRDLGMNLLRSESTQSYRNKIQFNGPGSTEFINRDTRRFLSDKLRNDLERESHSLGDVPLVLSSGSGSTLLGNDKIIQKEMEDTLQDEFVPKYLEIMKDEEMQTRSFRHGHGDGIISHGELSPRNLIRSLSAPVSGTSFGKLLLEDRNVLTGVHIRRKHEDLENVTMDLKKRKKERFNIKEKVCNFKYSFPLRGRIFGKKLQTMMETHRSEQDLVDDIMSGPTVVKSLGDALVMENSTEVPPSPASVCSSAQEDFWWPVDYLSPVPTTDSTPVDDSAMPEVFIEISSHLNELRRQLNQLETNEVEASTIEQEPDKCIMIDLGDKKKLTYGIC